MMTGSFACLQAAMQQKTGRAAAPVWAGLVTQQIIGPIPLSALLMLDSMLCRALQHEVEHLVVPAEAALRRLHRAAAGSRTLPEPRDQALPVHGPQSRVAQSGAHCLPVRPCSPASTYHSAPGACGLLEPHSGPCMQCNNQSNGQRSTTMSAALLHAPCDLSHAGAAGRGRPPPRCTW